jgi:hypothetical protein
VFAKGGSTGKFFVVTAQGRPIGARDVDVEVAIQHMTKLDIGEREILACQERIRG